MIDSRHDDEARRAFWTEQMDAASEFMQTVMGFPVEECGEPLAPLREAAEAAGVEVAFSGDKIADGRDRLYLLREGLVGPFLAAARDMNAQGLVLKVEDGYRTLTIQRGLGRTPRVFDAILKKVRWELGGAPPSPEMMFRRITALIATCPKIGTHMSGSAVDISVLSRDTGEELDRGCPYIDLSERTPMESPFVSEQAREARRRITKMMSGHGFAAYPYEFWHYSSGDAYDRILNGSSEPARYGAVDADLSTGRVTPVEDPAAPLHDPADIQRAIAESLDRVWP